MSLRNSILLACITHGIAIQCLDTINNEISTISEELKNKIIASKEKRKAETKEYEAQKHTEMQEHENNINTAISEIENSIKKIQIAPQTLCRTPKKNPIINIIESISSRDMQTHNIPFDENSMETQYMREMTDIAKKLLKELPRQLFTKEVCVYKQLYNSIRYIISFYKYFNEKAWNTLSQEIQQFWNEIIPKFENEVWVTKIQKQSIFDNLTDMVTTSENRKGAYFIPLQPIAASLPDKSVTQKHFVNVLAPPQTSLMNAQSYLQNLTQLLNSMSNNNSHLIFETSDPVDAFAEFLNEKIEQETELANNPTIRNYVEDIISILKHHAKPKHFTQPDNGDPAPVHKSHLMQEFYEQNQQKDISQLLENLSQSLIWLKQHIPG